MHLPVSLTYALALIGLASACAPPAGIAPARFYTGKPYGSESQFNPLSEIVNEGFDILQTNSQDRHVFRRDYALGASNVWRSVTHPDRTFRFYGYQKALRNEWLPLTGSDSKGGGAWVPNYEYHLLGSGMISVRLEEWYAQHEVPHPRALALGTAMAAHFLNEVVENGTSRVPNEDATTDLLLFDLGGLALWRIDAVQRVFSGPLQLTNWPGQPSIDIPSGTLQNVGQQFVLRAPLPFTRSWRLFYDVGMSSLLGLSRAVGDSNFISAAFGVDAVDNPVVDEATNTKGATLRPKGGLFFDRNGSLLASLHLGSRSDDAVVDVNIYPGVLRFGRVSPGVWLQHPRAGGVRFGIATAWGIGLGHGPER